MIHPPLVPRPTSLHPFPLLAALAVLATIPFPLDLHAAEAEKDKNGEKEKSAEKEGDDKETKSVTESEVTIGGQKISYTATAGTLPLTKADGEKRASVFYIAYERKNAGDTAKRPVTFCFNGGPGSSSVWLHLGAFGPKRVVLPPGGVDSPVPPFQLVANEHSLLDATDLVFIDPVSTGFSRAAKPDEARQFHGYNEDIEAVGEFIRRYISRTERWTSPKFLAGESYGGLRAAGLAGHLQERYGMYLNGIAIVSGVVDFKTLSPDAGNDVPHIAFLPTMTATAHYHRKLPPDLQQADVRTAVQLADAFAQGDYAAALLRGHALPADKVNEVAAQLARFTALPADFWVRERLRISPSTFRRKLLESENKLVGRFDARATADASSDEDPSYANVYGVFATQLNAYVRDELNYDSDLPYEILTRDVHPWSYASFTGRYVSSAAALGQAMTNNPSLRVFVACGHYDLATPAGGIEHTINHLPTDQTRLANVGFAYYEGGHMMYSNLDSLARLNADLRAFVTK
jgi:carboxypeptidase C (cathepsin A)